MIVKEFPIILLVDDDPEIVGVVAAMLRDMGFCVISASVPQKALSACVNSKTPIDLLITDFQMPKMNGLELAQLVQALQPGIKVLYMTAAEAPLQSPKEQELQCLSKPFNFAQLKIAVRRALSDAR